MANRAIRLGGGVGAQGASGSGGGSFTVTFSGSLGQVGLAYTGTLSSTGGTSPYTYTITSGTLPVIGTSSTSLTSGTGSQTFTTASGLGYVTGDLVQIVSAGTPAATMFGSITSYSGTSLVVNVTAAAGSGTGAHADWNLSVQLDPNTGVISGVPSAAGTFSFTAQSTDSTSLTAAVNCAVSISTTVVLKAMWLGPSVGYQSVFYGFTALAAQGGVTPYTWAITAGSLPHLLSLNTSNGQISGTPDTAGTSNFTAQVTDGVGSTATVACTITITPNVVLQGASLQWTVGVAVSVSLQASGGVAPYTYTLLGGTLPPGVTFSSGVLSGTPTTPGPYASNFQATDSNGLHGNAAWYINVLTASGSSVLAPISTATNGVVGRDVGYSTDIADPATRLVSFNVGITVRFQGFGDGAGLAEFATCYLSEDNGINFVWVGAQYWILSAQEHQISVVRPTNPTSWVVAAVPGQVGGDGAVTIPAANLPSGSVTSSPFTVAGLNLPLATDLASTSVTFTPGLYALRGASGVVNTGSGPVTKGAPANVSQTPQNPYNVVNATTGNQYWSIPSISWYDGNIGLSDTNAFYIRVTAQDYDANSNPIGPESPAGGAQVSQSGQWQSFGPLEGEYLDAGYQYTRSGNIAAVGLRFYVINRYDQTTFSFQDPNAAVLQTGIGSAGLLLVTVAQGGTPPTGALQLDQASTATMGPLLVKHPTKGTLTLPTANLGGTSSLPDPSFDYSTVGTWWSGTAFGVGGSQSWETLLGAPGSDIVTIMADGGASGKQYCRLQGPGCGIESELVRLQGNTDICLQVAIRSNASASGSHSVTAILTWYGSDEATVVGTNSFTASSYAASSWVGQGIYVKDQSAPSNAAYVTVTLQTNSADTGYWDVTDVLLSAISPQSIIAQNMAQSSITYANAAVAALAVVDSNMYSVAINKVTYGTSVFAGPVILSRGNGFPVISMDSGGIFLYGQGNASWSAGTPGTTAPSGTVTPLTTFGWVGIQYNAISVVGPLTSGRQPGVEITGTDVVLYSNFGNVSYPYADLSAISLTFYNGNYNLSVGSSGVQVNYSGSGGSGFGQFATAVVGGHSQTYLYISDPVGNWSQMNSFQVTFNTVTGSPTFQGLYGSTGLVLFQSGSAVLNFQATLMTYNGVNTQGWGLPAIVGFIRLTGQPSSTSGNLYGPLGNAPAGTYRATVMAIVTSGISASGNVAVSFYNDNGFADSAIDSWNFCTLNSTTTSGTQTFHHNGSGQINYNVSSVSWNVSGTYEAVFILERIGA